MTESALGPVSVTALRVGRTDVGAASAVLDDDALTLTVRVEAEERPLRLRLTSIDSAHRAGDELELILRDGTRVSLVAEGAFREAILDRCRSLPELTRTLRAFGSSRRRTGGRESHASEQQRFFGPLLEARRSAGGHPADAMHAFDGVALASALRETLHRFAADRHPTTGPAQRALEAELEDASEPLFDAFVALRESARAASGSADDLRLWRDWSSRLRATFEAADRVWMAIDVALDAVHRASSVSAPARPVR